MASDSLQGLLLLAAPLCFERGASPFGDALAFVPLDLFDEHPLPGSVLSHLSAMASPRTFVWSRLMDAAFSSIDRHALDLHARVERWALDEVPLPGRSVAEILGWLYRDDGLCRGTQGAVGDSIASPANLSAPMLAVVSEADDIAPLASVKPFTNAMPDGDVRLLEYSGDLGVGLQHLGAPIPDGRRTPGCGRISWPGSRLVAEAGRRRSEAQEDWP